MKYIIEIENEPFGRNDDPVIPHGMDELYRAKGFKSLVFDKNGLDKLTPYTEPDRKDIEDEVWDFASMLMDMHPDVAEDIYWSMNGGKGIGVAAEMTYQEAKSRYEEWLRQKDEIKAGDEVENASHKKGIVLNHCISPGKVLKYVRVLYMNDDGNSFTSAWEKNNVKKTGRHFPEVAELLEKMRGEEE